MTDRARALVRTQGIRIITVAAAAAVVLVGCGDDGDTSADVSPSPHLGFTRADVCNAIARGGEGLQDLAADAVGYTLDEASDIVLEYAESC